MKSGHTMKPSHMLLCAALLLVGVVLLLTGVGAGGLVLLPSLACGLMMGAMMWMMMRAGQDERGERGSRRDPWRPLRSSKRRGGSSRRRGAARRRAALRQPEGGRGGRSGPPSRCARGGCQSGCAHGDGDVRPAADVCCRAAGVGAGVWLPLRWRVGAGARVRSPRRGRPGGAARRGRGAARRSRSRSRRGRPRRDVDGGDGP